MFMDEKDQKIQELEAQIENLKKQLLFYVKQNEALRNQIQRQYRYNQDYLPYADEDEQYGR